MNTNNLTIVTALISCKSKHSINEYHEWASKLLKINKPMVIFTDSNNHEFIKNERKCLPTFIWLIEIEDLSTNKYRNKFNHQLGFYYYFDYIKNKKVNLDDYSIIINEKVNFLQKTAKLNYFNSDFFLWIDIGCLRNKQTLPPYWPDDDKIKILKQKILLMNINTEMLSEININYDTYTFKNPPNNILINGGIIGCNKNNIDFFHNLFYDKLEKIIQDKTEWAGNEQFILSHVYVENKKHINLIECKKDIFVKNDPWFYYIPFFFKP